MKYKIYDMQNNRSFVAGFDTREALAHWWKVHNCSDDDLNITGKDVVVANVLVGYKDCPAIYNSDGKLLVPAVRLKDYRKEQVLRRYQVVDEYDRPIDIRAWPDEVWVYRPVFKSMWWGCPGSKYLRRPTSGPSMFRGTRQASYASVDYDELEEDGLPVPARDMSSVRAKNLMDSTAVYDYHDASRAKRHTRSKCWKDQHKTMRQWSKKKRGLYRIPPANQTVDTGELFERLKKEGLPVA